MKKDSQPEATNSRTAESAPVIGVYVSLTHYNPIYRRSQA